MFRRKSVFFTLPMEFGRVVFTDKIDAPFAGTSIIFDPEKGGWLKFSRPLGILRAHGLSEVLPALAEVEAQVEGKGRFAAGFVSYEASPAFDPAFRAVTPGSDAPPLLWFGIYDAPEVVELPPPGPGFSPPGAFASSVTRAEYEAAVRRVKDHIANGDTYQVNYTLRLSAPFEGCDFEWFRLLVSSQQCLYAAYFDTGDFAVCSASPEVFFLRQGENVTCRPMKGTAPRGGTASEDEASAAWLYNSEKNRAENVMIVDMIRNDLGRVAETGTVEVPHLFSVERYPTVLQMTSTVTARTRAGFRELFSALFPCASITGAPKVNTMNIIAELETTPRGVYTGACGFLGPGNYARFNVAIRTVVVNRLARQALYGVGGGIVWDSEPAEEYEECNIKAAVLTRRRHGFSLLETLLWTPEVGWALLSEHLARLADSAAFFGFPFDQKAVADALDDLTAGFGPEPRRVRLLLNEDGLVEATHGPAPQAFTEAVSVAFSPLAVDSTDPMLRHKTTRREIYEKALSEARRSAPDIFDAIIVNERGEVTETAIANLVAEKDGNLYTPPVSSGLLPGTLRARLLAEGKIRERVMDRGFIESADALFLANSVRGLVKARLAETGDSA